MVPKLHNLELSQGILPEKYSYCGILKRAFTTNMFVLIRQLWNSKRSHNLAFKKLCHDANFFLRFHVKIQGYCFILVVWHVRL